MACTEAIEDAVHRHMNDQIAYLSEKDNQLKELIATIQVEELQHLNFARQNVKQNIPTKFLERIIYMATEIVIWLSTQGDVSRMRREIKV